MFNDEESAKLALSDTSKRISEIKDRQWKVATHCALILVFLATIFNDNSPWFKTKIPTCYQYVLVAAVVVYFVSIFTQTLKNIGRFKNIYNEIASTWLWDGVKDKYQGEFIDRKSTRL